MTSRRGTSPPAGAAPAAPRAPACSSLRRGTGAAGAGRWRSRRWRGSCKNRRTGLFLLEHETCLALDHAWYLRSKSGEQRRERELDPHVVVGNLDGPADELGQCGCAKIEAVAGPSLIFDPEQGSEVRRKVGEALP